VGFSERMPDCIFEILAFHAKIGWTEGEILFDCLTENLRLGVLEDIAHFASYQRYLCLDGLAAIEHCSTGRLRKADKVPHKKRFARSVSASNYEEFSFGDRKRNVVDGCGTIRENMPQGICTKEFRHW
jgi:hypothetical protein